MGSKRRVPIINVFLGLCLGLVFSEAIRADTTAVTAAPADVTIAGSSPATLNLPLTRSGDTSYDTWVNYSTTDGSAMAGKDYTAANGVIDIPAGASSVNIPVQVFGISSASPDKYFTLDLSGIAPSGPTPSFASQQAFGTGSSPYSVAVADVNGDGLPDVIVANQNSSTVSVFLNTTTPGAATPTFAASQDFPAGGLPYSLAVADMNGDGKPDIVVADGGSNMVAVLVNTTTTGSSTVGFTAPQTASTASNPYSVRVADVNGDGKPDVIVAYEGAGTVSVVLNTTTPGSTAMSFGTPQPFGSGTNPYSVAVADLNGDGRPDLIVANEGDDDVSVFLNATAAGASTPNFVGPFTLTTGTNPYSVTAADLNGDGRPDLIVANQGSNTVSVLLNTTAAGASTPSFAAQQTFATGTAPTFVAAADLNGDGRPDLVVTNQGSGTVSVLENITAAGTAAPNFVPQQTFAVGSGPVSVAVADLNGDGRPDLIATNAGDGTFSVLLSTLTSGGVTPSFSSPQVFGAGGAPQYVTLADVNGDGKPDLIVANEGDTTVSVFLNTTPTGATTPSFAAQQEFSTGTSGVSPDFVAVADLNGDGKPDLVVVNSNSTTVAVLLNTTPTGATSPSFAAEQNFSVGNSPNSAALAALNGDGKPDLIVANFSDSTVSVLLNTTPTGATSPSFAAQQTFATGNSPTSVAAADMNGDGKPDLIVANAGSDTVSILLNTTAPGATTPSFATQQTFSTGSSPASVAVADLNGDGKPDLVTANGGRNNVSVLLNTTTPGSSTLAFAAQQTFSTDGTLASSAIMDMDGDGKPDIVVTNSFSNTVDVLLNTTSPGAATPSFASEQSFSAGTSGSLAVGDVNGDGKPDLIVTTRSIDSVSVLLNSEYIPSLSPTSVVGLIDYQLAVPPVADSLDLATYADQAIDGFLPAAVTPSADSLSFSAGSASHGTVSVTNAATGAFTYTPANGYTGSDAFTFTATDTVTSLSSGTATVSVTVNDVAPVAGNGNYETTPELAVSGTLSGSAAYGGQTLSFAVATTPSHGGVSITNAATGAFTYTPATGYSGADSFSFTVGDGASDQSSPATVSITVKDVAATAQGASHTLDVDHAFSGSLPSSLAYSGQTRTYHVVTKPAHGTASITNTATGTFKYTPSGAYVGTDSFSFDVTDAYGTKSNSAKESFTIKDLAATAHNGSLTTTENKSVAGKLSASLAYTGQVLSYVLVRKPSHGTVTFTNTATGAFTYKPTTNFVGKDSFTFEVKDSHGTVSNVAAEIISVGR